MALGQEKSNTEVSATTNSINAGTTATKSKLDVVDVIGNNGPWQRRIFFATFFLYVLSAGQNLGIAFIAPELDYWCARLTEARSSEKWENPGVPSQDGKCSRYLTVNLTVPENFENGSAVPCDAWEYDKSFYTSTIVTKWNLVCDREWLVSLTKSIYALGVMVSMVISGDLADRVGRRPMISGCCILVMISSSSCALSTSFLMYIISRFFIALGTGGYYYCCYVLLVEVVDPKKRDSYGIFVQAGWTLGFILLPAVAWLVRDWFWITVSMTVPYFIYLGAWWFFPESPRWLLSKGRIEEAKRILIHAATINGKHYGDIEYDLEKIIAEAHKDFETGETKGTLLDLIRMKELRRTTLIIFFGWLVTGFIIFGLDYNTNELPGNPFLNFFLIGVIEIPGQLISFLVMKYFGRRKSVAWIFITAGIVCLLSYFGSANSAFAVAVAVIGKLCIAASYYVVCIYTPELFPTILRSTGNGWAGLFLQIGTIMAPFVRELAHNTGSFVPFMLFGILSLISGVLFLFLPETQNCKVPDTLAEAADAINRNKERIS